MVSRCLRHLPFRFLSIKFRPLEKSQEKKRKFVFPTCAIRSWPATCGSFGCFLSQIERINRDVLFEITQKINFQHREFSNTWSEFIPYSFSCPSSSYRHHHHYYRYGRGREETLNQTIDSLGDRSPPARFPAPDHISIMCTARCCLVTFICFSHKVESLCLFTLGVVGTSTYDTRGSWGQILCVCEVHCCSTQLSQRCECLAVKSRARL